MKRMAGAGVRLVWLVPGEQAEAYRAFGADAVITGPHSKSVFMNLILDHYADQWCVFSDDDCREMVMLSERDRLVDVPLGMVAREFVRVGRQRGDHLVNIPHITNRRYMNHTVSDWGPISGWFFAVAPDTECRFDPSLRVAEDVDFGAQVVERYGRLARPNYVQATYLMGGAKSNFNHERDDLPCSAIVAARYPHLIAGYGPPRAPGTSGVLRYRPLPRVKVT